MKLETPATLWAIIAANLENKADMLTFEPHAELLRMEAARILENHPEAREAYETLLDGQIRGLEPPQKAEHDSEKWRAARIKAVATRRRRVAELKAAGIYRRRGRRREIA